MTDFLSKLNAKTENYFKKWASLVSGISLSNYPPVAIGWKVTDVKEFNDVLSGLLKDSVVSQCHIGFVDKRYIATIVFKEPIYQSVHILKLMQRRPGSIDQVGLDHVDFYAKDLAVAKKELQKEGVGKVTDESNESHHWISLWVSGTEAKFVDHTVLDVGVKELRNISLDLGFKPRLMN